jgi:O-acetyl-ADP-ribose deacetylase (regulator of RNase III)
MIEERFGNALDVPEGIIVHGCNCQGVMGSGIAAEVKRRFPEAFRVYRECFTRYGLTSGNIIDCEVAPNKIIVNAMTQIQYGTDKRHVDYEAVAKCFEKVKEIARSVHLNREKDCKKLDIIFPMIGAGLGGGNWKIISTIIDETIGDDFKKVLYKLPS